MANTDPVEKVWGFRLFEGEERGRVREGRELGKEEGRERLVFDDMSERNMVSCACLFSGYVQNSYAIGTILRGCYKLESRGVGLRLQIHGFVLKMVDANVSTSGGNTSCANDETSMNDSLMMIVCEQRAAVEIHDEPYNVIKNWNYTALVDAIHNGEGKCWTTKAVRDELGRIRIQKTEKDPFHVSGKNIDNLKNDCERGAWLS
ncbi:hypothetical protein AgCh_025546 [Apium graveolens]